MNLLEKAEAAQPHTGSREEELNSTISEGKSSGKLGRLNATWYLNRSNISNYTIVIINIQHVPELPVFNLLLDKLVSYLNDLKKKETLSTVKAGKEILGTKTPHKVL